MNHTKYTINYTKYTYCTPCKYTKDRRKRIRFLLSECFFAFRVRSCSCKLQRTNGFGSLKQTYLSVSQCWVLVFL